VDPGARAAPSPPRLPPWLAIGAVAVALTAVDLGRQILHNDDQVRFAVLARDIVHGGDWLRPRLVDAPYHYKPPLLAWLIALVAWPTGSITRLGAVLPSAAAAVATVLVTLAAGRRLFGDAAGRAAALVALTTYGLYVHARLPMTDVLMTCFITASAALLWPMTASGSRRAAAGFYACTAAAVWSKGLAGFLPLAIAIAWALVSRQPGRWTALRLPWGLPLALAIVAPWLLFGAVAEPGAFQAGVVDNQLRWFVRHLPSSEAFTGPLENLTGVLAPWVLVLPLAVARAARRLRAGGAAREPVLFVVCWAAVAVGAVALSSEQRFRYYLPAIPPAALLIGWWAADLLASGRRPGGRVYWSAVGALGAAALAAIAITGRVGPVPVVPAWIVLVPAVLIAALAAAVARAVAQGRLRRAFAIAWCGAAVAVAAFHHLSIVSLDAVWDYPRFTARVAEVAGEAPVFAWGVPELPLTFYADRTVRPVRSGDEVERRLAEHPGAVVVLSEGTFARLRDPSRVTTILTDRLGGRPVLVVGVRR
jgi:4-amino-4-deoxy-L-arabinose transferase-like glycosyltransferase